MTQSAWPLTRLGDIAHVLHGWPFRSESYAAEGIDLPIVVAIGNFEYSGGFRFERSTVKRYTGEYPAEYELDPGDLLLVMTCQTEGGEILGVPGRVPDDGRTYLHNQRIGRLVIDRPDGLDADFAFQLARTADFNRQLCLTASGSKILHTAPRRIEATTFHRPPIKEQRAIAEVLGALDDKIAANADLARSADELAALVFDGAIEGAPLRAMSSILKPVLGGTPARARTDFWGGDRLWASAKDIAGAPFGVLVATQECITDKAVSQTKAKPLPKGSVILTARGTVGAVARLGSPSSLNQSCYGFVPDVLPPGVLYFSILGATDRARAFAHGSVFDTITMRTFDHLEVVDMPASELRQVEARVGPLLAKVEQSVRENESLAAMRDALLPLLMSGKLRVKDAEQMVGDVV